MKIVTCAMLTALVCAASVARLKAEPVSSQSDPSVNPHALEDPDGVPLQVTNPELFQPSQAELARKKQADEKAEKDKSWLLRGYQQQMNDSSSQNSTQDFINQISASKELSALAGIPYHGDQADTRLALKTGAPATDKGGLRTDTPLPNPLSRADSLLSKPFFSSASTLPGLSSPPHAALPGSGGSSATFSSPPPPPRAPLVTPPPADSDSMALSSPGLVAAQSNLVGTGFSSNLTLDLPDPNAQPDERTTTIPTLELPLKTNAERLARQNAAMGVATTKATTTTVVKPIPYPTEPETVPITRSSFGRSALADPHNDNFLLH